jgi:hypothetical protein
MRLGAPALVLAAGACLGVAGCGGSGTSSVPASGGGDASAAAAGGSISSGNASGGSNGAACTAFATAYSKFLSGYVPPESQTGTNETPLRALSDAVSNITASGQLETDLSSVGIDAGLIATGSTEGGQTTPPSTFYSDLQAVGHDCGTTYTQPSASLVKEG